MTDMDPRRRKAVAIGEFEERCAIIEHDGKMHRLDAEQRAGDELGGRPGWSGSILNVIALVGP